LSSPVMGHSIEIAWVVGYGATIAPATVPFIA
jgi:hypothetical protein